MAIHKRRDESGRVATRLLLESTEPVELPPAEIDEQDATVEREEFRQYLPELLDILEEGGWVDPAPMVQSDSIFVIEGEIWVGDTHCPAGTHIELPFGAAFGPIRAGDAGARLFEVMLGDPRSWGDQPEAFERVLEEHGATPLPDVELDYPDWLQDLRQHWVGAADPQPTSPEGDRP